MAKRKNVMTAKDIATELPSQTDLDLVAKWLKTNGHSCVDAAFRRVMAAAQLTGMQHAFMMAFVRHLDETQYAVVGLSALHREAKQLVGFVKPKEIR